MIGRRFGVLLTLALFACGAAAHEDHDAKDARRLIAALDAAPGSVLADVGAGPDAPLTLPIARHVGPSGRVYATELEDEDGTLAKLRDTIDKAGADNIAVVEGHPSRTNLPPACCDGIFMRNVYHHIADQEAMNASLSEALKPGGRLAVLDFQPRRRGSDSPDRDGGGLHGIAADSVAKELSAAGFEVVVTEIREHGEFLVVARKSGATR